jgi:tetratricopeptide (TPR) repeat protein
VGWLLDRREPDRALALADGFLARNPGDVPARVQRARALAATGATDAAEAALHDLLNEAPESAQARLALAELYLAQGRAPDARFHAAEGERLDPAGPDFPRILGEAALAEGNLEGARAAFLRARDLAPDRTDGWTRLGRLEMQRGRPDAAAELFDRARELSPDDWTAAYLLGLAESEAGRPQEAIKAYRTVLARDERVAEAHNNLAWLLADLDLDPVLAEVHARRAAELAPANPQVLGTLGWAQYKNRLLDDAAATLARAVEGQPDDPMKRYMLGVVEFHRGQRDAARRALGEALRLSPSFGRAERARELLDRLDG